MPDPRFQDKNGFCKLCHKICYRREDSWRLVMDNDMGFVASYECPLYPHGYWHVTRKRFPNHKTKRYSWQVHVKKLGKERANKIFQRIEKILDS